MKYTRFFALALLCVTACASVPAFGMKTEADAEQAPNSNDTRESEADYDNSALKNSEEGSSFTGEAEFKPSNHYLKNMRTTLGDLSGAQEINEALEALNMEIGHFFSSDYGNHRDPERAMNDALELRTVSGDSSSWSPQYRQLSEIISQTKNKEEIEAIFNKMSPTRREALQKVLSAWHEAVEALDLDQYDTAKKEYQNEKQTALKNIEALQSLVGTPSSQSNAGFFAQFAGLQRSGKIVLGIGSFFAVIGGLRVFEWLTADAQENDKNLDYAY